MNKLAKLYEKRNNEVEEIFENVNNQTSGYLIQEVVQLNKQVNTLEKKIDNLENKLDKIDELIQDKLVQSLEVSRQGLLTVIENLI